MQSSGSQPVSFRSVARDGVFFGRLLRGLLPPPPPLAWRLPVLEQGPPQEKVGTVFLGLLVSRAYSTAQCPLSSQTWNNRCRNVL